MSAPRKRFCRRGHDTAVCGRVRGDCAQCRVTRRAAWQRTHPHAMCTHYRSYRTRKARRAEIQAAKAVLLSAHRLRTVGVTTHSFNRWRRSFDSWSVVQ